ncbi:MAG: acetate/propionate family kinase [Alphaproteobacteria bacterium]
MSEKKPETFLVINAGSSSIKYGLYNSDDLTPIEHKTIETKKSGGYGPAIEEILKLVETHNVKAIGHRVVHGGKDYAAPVKVDDKVLADLEKLSPLAPLHQPHNLKTIKTIADKYPDLPQVASFDTAFHRTQSKLSQMYALPRKLTEDEGIVRYGFHGLSYEYVASVLPEVAGEEVARGRVIVAHLGNGASMAAIKDGKSVATSMGFTPLDGLMMGTRAGATDPGILLYLLEKGETAKSLSDIFQKQSGLKGVSGITEDVRELLASDKPEAKEAIDLFCLYAARQAASLTVDLGGVDAIVFTGGIGENSEVVREKILGNLAHLGVKVDTAENNADKSAIHAADSKIKVFVIKTDEELMMAQHVKKVLAPAAQKPAAPGPKV